MVQVSFYIILGVLGVLLSLGVILFNLTFMLSVGKTTSLQQITYVLLLCFLSLVDFIKGIVIPFFVYELFQLSAGGSLPCTYVRMVTTADEFMNTLSFFHIALITTERYIATFHTYRHIYLFSVSRVLSAVMIVWLIACTLTIMPFIANIPRKIFVFRVKLPVFAFTIIIQILMYCRMWKETVRIRRQIRDQFVAVHATNPTDQNKAGRTALVIFLALTACYVPQFVMVYLKDYLDIIPVGNHLMFCSSACTILFFDSFINPITYYILNQKLRESMLKVLKDVFKLEQGDRQLKQVSSTSVEVESVP